MLSFCADSLSLHSKLSTALERKSVNTLQLLIKVTITKKHLLSWSTGQFLPIIFVFFLHIVYIFLPLWPKLIFFSYFSPSLCQLIKHNKMLTVGGWTFILHQSHFITESKFSKVLQAKSFHYYKNRPETVIIQLYVMQNHFSCREGENTSVFFCEVYL